MNHTTQPQFASIQNTLRAIQPDLLRSLDAIWQSNQTPYQQLILMARLARHDARIAEIVRALLPLRLGAATERRAVEAELARATGNPAGLPIPPRPEPRPGEGHDPTVQQPPRPEPIEIRIDPEIARLAVAMRRDSELRLWMVLKFISGASSGYMGADGLYEQVCQVVRDYTRRHFNRLLAAGAGTFWNVDDRRRVFLWGGAALARNLVRLAPPQLVSSNPPGARDMLIPVGNSIQEFRAHCLGAWYAHRENPTISRARLAALWGRDADTLRRWERLIVTSQRGKSLMVAHNYGQALVSQEQSAGIPSILDNPSIRHNFAWGGQSLITLQISNTYFVHGYRQAPARGRGWKRHQTALDLLEQLPMNAGQSPVWRGVGSRCERLYWETGKQLETHNRRADEPARAWVYIGQDRRGFRRWSLTEGYPDTRPDDRARGRAAFRYATDSQARRRSFLSKCSRDIFAAPYGGDTPDYAKAWFTGGPAVGGGGLPGGRGLST